jgi:hypothetical protein
MSGPVKRQWEFDRTDVKRRRTDSVEPDVQMCVDYVVGKCMDDCSDASAVYKAQFANNGLLSLDTYSHHCWNRGGCHSNNHVSYHVGKKGIRQACLAKDCPQSDWRPWPSPREDWTNRLFFGRPDFEYEGKCPPAYDTPFLQWSMTSQEVNHKNVLSGDVVPDFFAKAPVDLYAPTAWGFLKINHGALQRDGYNNAPPCWKINEVLSLADEWLRQCEDVQYAFTLDGYMESVKDGTGKHATPAFGFNVDEQGWRRYVKEQDEGTDEEKEKSALKQQSRIQAAMKHYETIAAMIKSSPNETMKSYLAQVRSRTAKVGSLGGNLKAIYDELLRVPGLDVHFMKMELKTMVIKFLIQIVKNERWARQGLQGMKGGEFTCNILHYDEKSKCYHKRFTTINAFVMDRLNHPNYDHTRVMLHEVSSSGAVLSCICQALTNDATWPPRKAAHEMPFS